MERSQGFLLPQIYIFLFMLSSWSFKALKNQPLVRQSLPRKLPHTCHLIQGISDKRLLRMNANSGYLQALHSRQQIKKKISVRRHLPTAVVHWRGEEKPPKQDFTTTTRSPTKKLSFWNSKKTKFNFKDRCYSKSRKQESWHIHLCVQMNDLMRHRNKGKQCKTNCSNSGTSYWPSRPMEHAVSGSTSRMCIKHQLLCSKANTLYSSSLKSNNKSKHFHLQISVLSAVTIHIYKQVRACAPSPALTHLNHAQVTFPKAYKYPLQL